MDSRISAIVNSDKTPDEKELALLCLKADILIKVRRGDYPNLKLAKNEMDVDNEKRN